MGEASRRLQQFIGDHANCAFCGGSVPTDTIDHVPPRIFFLDKHIPGDLDVEFPACIECNENCRQYDQIAAMISLISPREPRPGEQEHFRRTTNGIFNNANSAVYELMDGMIGLRREAKTFRRKTGLEGFATKFGSTSLLAIRVLTAKLGLAYYYRQTRIILPVRGAVVTDIVTNSQILEDRVPPQHQWALPFKDLTQHAKHPGQLLYRFGLLSDQSGGIFHFGLHENIMLVAIVTNDLSRHQAAEDTDFVFRPGFAKSLSAPEREVRYSL